MPLRWKHVREYPRMETPNGNRRRLQASNARRRRINRHQQRVRKYDHDVA
jgi:hypothetical protein